MPKPNHNREAVSDVIFGQLLDRRTIVLTGEIDDDIATRAISQLLLLMTEDAKADIELYIESPGGSFSAALAILDIMNFIDCDVSTWAIGRVGSVSHLILASGAQGKRYATSTSLISLDCSLDLQRRSSRGPTEEWLSEIAHLTAQQTSRPVDQVTNDLLGSADLTAPQARRYGLIDAIVDHVPSAPHGN